MKKRTLTILTIFSAILLAGCYPQGAEYVEDLDVVITKHNEKYDFSAKSTYAMPDKIVKVTGNKVEGDNPEFIPDIYAGPILSRIATNMEAMGWTKIDMPLDESDPQPDVLLLPAAWETTSTYYYYDYWYWWYGGYYPYWPYYPPVYYSSYTTGTLFWTLIDPDETDGTGTPIRQWAAASNGLLSYSFDATRINKAIDQAFNQSPYIQTN